MMLYQDIKATIQSPGMDTNFFNIVTGVLQGDKFGAICIHNLPRLFNTNLNRSNERKLFHAKIIGKKETISDKNYN